MLQAVPVRPSARERIPAVVHADGTARVQTVRRDADSRYHRLLSAFARRTGEAVVLNTSLNAVGEPMAETAADALRCLRTMGFDALVVGDHLVWPAGAPEPVPGPETP
jgi:carbamoyltransferase